MKSKLLNVLLIVIIVLLLCGLLGVVIYEKVKENEKGYSKNKLVEIYESIKYDDKINLYLFHGESCPHCKKELEFFKNMDEEYKSKYNLYTFEVWNDKNNQRFKEIVIDTLVKEGKLTGKERSEMTMDDYYAVVPFIIIGDKYIIGYNNEEDIGSQIKQNIDNEKDKGYDIMKKIEKSDLK